MFYRLKLWLNEFRRFAQKQPPIRLLLTALCILALLALLIEGWTRPAPSPYVAPEIYAIRDRGVLRVALRSDAPGFAYCDPESGEWSGLEVDVAKAVAYAIFNEDSRVEFVPSSSRILSRLDNHEADIVFAQLIASNTRFAYTPSYYTDAYALLTLSGASSGISGLAGRVIGVTPDFDAPTPEEPPSMQALIEYGESTGASYTFRILASYPELIEALDARVVDAALMQAALVPKYFDATKAAIPEAVSKLPYCAAMRGSEAGLAQIASAAVRSLAESGELERLREAYKLPKF